MQTERPASVLLVDDRPEKLLAIESLLADMRLEIVRATSGREALRHLLQRDFALILLDVNMPGMDGLETAALIRARKSSEHIPIIFITAYGDEIFMERGYSLGAVDYILQPVVPEILRAKVSVFVELYQKTEEIKRQAEAHSHRASQLQRLAQASMHINAASSVDRILDLTTSSARDLIGAASAIATVALADDEPPRFAHDCDLENAACANSGHTLTPAQRDSIWSLLKHHKSLRIDPHSERAADWGITSAASPLVTGLLAAQLAAGDGHLIGFVAILDKTVASFAEEDEAILLLLVQMASIAIENLQSADARAANKAKDQFLAVLSHELRTPLTPVLATLSQLHPTDSVPPELRDDLDMIRRNVELEARLIDDLLDLTKINKGKIELQVDSVDVHSLILDAIRICQIDIDAKSHTVHASLDAARSHVRGDPTRLHQILWNLLKNAVKFTAPGGTITIASENIDNREGGGGKPGEDLIIRVTDSGIGIDPDILPRIFNAFEQGKRSITRQFGGLGLGLTITKALVDAHHGTITAASAGLNTGSVFTLALPVDQARRAAAPVAQSQPRPSPAARPLKILLVEDHIDTGRVMTKLLATERHQVTLAKNTADALHLFKSHDFDVVISDIGLPDGSGLDLMRAIQAIRPIPAIALSGFGMDEDIRRSRDAGFHEHITKPINFTKLIHSLARLSIPPASPSPKLERAATA
jgi:signal transduction histidine kinase/DNA-binding response OmpR family regulator